MTTPQPPAQPSPPYGAAGFTGNPYANPAAPGRPIPGQPIPGQPGIGGNPYAQGQPQGQGYPQGYPQGAPQGHPGPYPQPMNGAPACQFCGGMPALKATVRGHQGFLVIMRFLKLKGQFCHDCGIALHREMTARTLWQGWWGIASFIITPVTLAINAVTRVRLSKLPRPTGGLSAPQPMGKPVIRRAAALGALIPVLAFAALIGVAALDDSPDTAQAGDCVHVNGDGPLADVQVVDCTSSQAQFRVVERHSGSVTSTCPQNSTSAYTETGGSDSFTLCLGSRY